MTQDNNKKGEKIIVYADEDIAELIPGFLANRHRDIEKIDEALKKGDYKTIQILGHSMKGTGGGYGFDAITKIGSSLEQTAKDEDIEEIRKWTGELLSYLERVEVRYK